MYISPPLSFLIINILWLISLYLCIENDCCELCRCRGSISRVFNQCNVCMPLIMLFDHRNSLYAMICLTMFRPLGVLEHVGQCSARLQWFCVNITCQSQELCLTTVPCKIASKYVILFRWQTALNTHITDYDHIQWVIGCFTYSFDVTTSNSQQIIAIIYASPSS